MKHIHHRIHRTASRLLGLLLLLLSSLPAGAEESCIGDDPGPPVVLHWVAVPNPDDVARLDQGRLVLAATNGRTLPLDLEILVTVDAGTADRKDRSYRLNDLSPGRRQDVTIDLAAFGLDTRAMRYSGQILAHIRAVPASSPRSGPATPSGSEEAVAPLLYFHRESDGTWFAYGESALQMQYRAGDLRGAHRLDPDTTVLRVTEGRTARSISAESRREAVIPSAEEEHDAPGGSRTSSTLLGGTDKGTGPRYRLCIRWEVDLVDSGKSILSDGETITEDYWSTSGKIAVLARGVRVKVSRGGWSHTFDAGPSTGCFEFSHQGSGPFEVRVYAYSTDKNGNVLRVRDAANKTFSFVKTVDLQPGEQTVDVGSYGPRASLAAVAAFSAYRANFGTSGKQIDIEEISACGTKGGNASSAHYNDDDLDEGLAHVRIHMGNVGDAMCSPSDHRRYKFIISHEIGHAWMLLHTKKYEPDTPTNLVDDTETVCGTGPEYSITSLEWSSIGAREGMAHFYATEVWNSHASNKAVFTLGTPYNAGFSSPHVKGGRLGNECTADDKCGKAVNIDWLRFWWDWHTPFSHNDRPPIANMRTVYVNAILSPGINRSSYYPRLLAAVSSLPENWQATWKESADWNGVHLCTEGGPVPFSYPKCDFDDPADGRGQPGCLCANVQVPTQDSKLGEDGAYPDGPGSYLENGPGGPGQFCEDDEKITVCGEATSLGSVVSVCEVCGEDTMIGCPCQNDEACQAGLDSEPLSCWGAPGKWPGTDRPGTCLPSGSDPASRERLTEMPWFCLDNCGTKGDSYVCLYDQAGLAIEHGECVSHTASGMFGSCEELGLVANPNAQPGCTGETCCMQECTKTEDCKALWGFPEDYVCDIGKGTYGHCVIDGCGTGKADVDPAFCNLFR
jgi:hypothetical protein